MTTTQKLPEYESITSTLRDLGSLMHAAEVHGTLCGLICGGKGMNTKIWLDGFFETPQFESAKEAQEVLLELCEITKQQLHDDLMSFQLLLPDDDEPIRVRTEALVEWSAGFLTGLALAGIDNEDIKKNEELSEIMHDVIEISRLAPELVAESEEEEANLFDVLEYQRMIVIMLYRELSHQIVDHEKNPKKKLH